jgi:protein ImuA
MQSKQYNHVQVEALRQQIARLEGTAPRGGSNTISSGSPALDRALPGGGFRSGTLVEWLAAGDGAGEATLALQTAAQASRDDGGVVILDGTGEFYPPAAVRLGIEPRSMIVIHVEGKHIADKADYAWALDQSLRCAAVAAVVAWPERWGKLDGRTFRRLQLAVEEGGGLGLLIRPAAVRHEPSWADVRLLVEPLPGATRDGRQRRLRIVVLRCRGGASRHEVEVEVNDAAHPLSVD